jgi:hypothetical protein
MAGGNKGVVGMKILLRPRACGKTYEAVLESSRSGATIVCATDAEKKRIESIARTAGLGIPSPLSCQETFTKLQGRHASVIVDNADWVLRMFLGADVHGITVEGPPAEFDWSKRHIHQQPQPKTVRLLCRTCDGAHTSQVINGCFGKCAKSA